MSIHRTRTLSALFSLALLCVLALGAMGLAPEPDPIPKRWQLNIDVGPMRMVTLDADKENPQSFFYMTYRVTNKTGQDLLFAPAFDLVAEDGKIRRSGQGVSAETQKAIIARLNNELIADQIAILGTIKQGPENARDGIVVWPVESLTPGDTSIFAAGFSGETTTVSPPDGAKDAKKVVLRKTLMVRYSMPGSLKGRGDEAFSVLEQRWIMR